MVSIKVLIVEDEVISGVALGGELESLGLTVCSLATNAEEALAVAEEECPDVVLMDLNLGDGGDGIEVAKLLFERFAAPSLFITGYSPEQTSGRLPPSLSLGCLTKPLRASDVKEVLDNHFREATC
jgi:CheY-like chemotaxis protein